LAKAILFSEGALLDSGELQFLALNSAQEAQGLGVTLQEYVQRLGFLSLPERLDYLAHTRQLEPILVESIRLETLHRWHCAIDLCVRPDRLHQALMLTLRTFGVRIAVCSTAPQDLLGSALEALGLRLWVDVAIGSDQHVRLDDLFSHAAGTLGLPLSECVVVEDSPLGLMRAVASGFPQIIHLERPQQLSIQLLRQYLPSEPLPRAA